jgi:hypothetical protein
MKDDHLTLRLPAALARALARLARTRGLPRSQLVREAIAGYVGSPAPPVPERTAPPRTARELAAAWSHLPRLARDDADDFVRDLTRSRESAVLPDEHWE